MMFRRKIFNFLGGFDWLLFAAMALIVVIGIAFILSGSLPGSMDPVKQILFSLVGLALFSMALIPHYSLLEDYAFPLYFAVLLALTGLLLFGHFVDVNQSNFSRRWVRIPLLDFSAQPSEFMKLAYVAAMARYLMFRKNYRSFAGLAAPAAMTLGPAALILLEPDLGTALLFPPVFFVMLYVAGARRRHLAALGALGLALMLMAFFADNITGALAGRGIVFSKSVAALKPYQKARITSFVQNTSYQQRQSVMAVGSGKLFGKGWRQGTQNRYNLLPERHTDFIFAVVAEESGFLGCIGLLALYFVILLCSFAVASRTSDPFARLLVTGLFASFTVQMFINAAMTVRLMPITGLTLPLVSYGGSSLTATMLAIALIMNVRLHPTPTFASKVFDFDET